MTNFEKIKNMNIDQLAETLNDSFACDRCPIRDYCDKIVSAISVATCSGVWIIWLKSEVQKQ